MFHYQRKRKQGKYIMISGLNHDRNDYDIDDVDHKKLSLQSIRCNSYAIVISFLIWINFEYIGMTTVIHSTVFCVFHLMSHVKVTSQSNVVNYLNEAEDTDSTEQTQQTTTDS